MLGSIWIRGISARVGGLRFRVGHLLTCGAMPCSHMTEAMLGPACRGAGWTEVFRDGHSEHKFEVEGKTEEEIELGGILRREARLVVEM